VLDRSLRGSCTKQHQVSSSECRSKLAFFAILIDMQPVMTHVICVMLALSCYLGWASFGQVITGKYALFWLDREKMESTEVVCAYSAGFIAMGPIGK